MQIHDTANSRFSKAKVEEFWRMVDSINWEEGRNAESVKSDLMKIVSPTAAETNKRIAFFYALHLVDLFKIWHRNAEDDQQFDIVYLEFAASNVVGGGKFNYDQFLIEPKFLANEVQSVSVDDNFSKCLPSDDDYYFATT